MQCGLFGCKGEALKHSAYCRKHYDEVAASYFKGDNMERKDKLEILELFSALESWGFSTQKLFPDYLHERIGIVMDKLREEILK